MNRNRIPLSRTGAPRGAIDLFSSPSTLNEHLDKHEDAPPADDGSATLREVEPAGLDQTLTASADDASKVDASNVGAAKDESSKDDGAAPAESESEAVVSDAEESDAGKTDTHGSDPEEQDDQENAAPTVAAPAYVPPTGPIELIEDDDEQIQLDWYILKVQSNRERSISTALQRKVAIEGLDRFFGEIMVPTEKVTEFKAGKKKVVERKLWPGYIAVQMHVCDETWFAIRETSGIGDFTGASGKPTPMQPHEIAMILKTEVEVTGEEPKLNIKFNVGDKVKVKDGNFESFEGDVDTIDESSGKITIMLSIFGRSTPVELEYWQVEAI